MELIAEDLLLLLIDELSGRPLIDSTRMTSSLAGALLLELALTGVVVPEDPTVRTGKSKVVALGQQPADPLLQLAWESCSDKPRRAAAVIQKLDSRVKEPLLDRIAAKGWVREERSKVLGMFTRTHWPEADGRHEAELRNAVGVALLQGGRPDNRIAALISLLLAAEALPKVFPDADKKALKVRATELSEGEWAGAAVKQAISEVQAAVMAAVITPVIVSTGPN